MDRFKDVINEMTNLGNFLVPYTYPIVSLNDEKDVKILKYRELVVDGYELSIIYSKADYGEHYMEVVQVEGLLAPFLPFNLVCKIGRTFLGSDSLALIEIFKFKKKVYCWTLYTHKESGEFVMHPEADSKPCCFEGFNFSSMNPRSVNFY